MVVLVLRLLLASGVSGVTLMVFIVALVLVIAIDEVWSDGI